MRQPKFFAKVVVVMFFIMLESVLIFDAKVIYDHSRNYDEISLRKLLLNHAEYEGKGVCISGKALHVNDDGSIFFIRQDRLGENSGFDVCGAFLEYGGKGSYIRGISDDSIIKVYGEFRDVGRGEAFMPAIRVNRYEKLGRK